MENEDGWRKPPGEEAGYFGAPMMNPMMRGFRPPMNPMANPMGMPRPQQFPMDARFQPNMPVGMQPGFAMGGGIRPIRLRPPPPKTLDAPEE